MTSRLSPLTFAEIVNEFPPPQEIPPEVIQAAFESFDHNSDGSLCVRPLPTGALVVVDNTAKGSTG